MLKKNYFFKTLIFFFWCSIVSSQMSIFPYELSSNKINASIVDSYGLTWIATEEGLNMFDGRKVHVFTSVLSDNKSLLNSAIINIIELKNKELIFISRDGLSIFDRPNFSFKRLRIFGNYLFFGYKHLSLDLFQ